MSNEPTNKQHPGDEIPECDPNRMTFIGDGTCESQIFRYSHDKHSERDLFRPDYFRSAISRGLRRGDEIHYTVGSPDPTEARRGFVVVEVVPGKKGVAANQPLTVAIVVRFGKPTPVRHGGEYEDDSKSKPKAA